MFVDAEQWVAVICEGQIGDSTVTTYIQGDTFLLAALESVRWWREKVNESN